MLKFSHKLDVSIGLIGSMNKRNFDKLKKDIIVICDYLAEEKKHYEESNRPQNHIWRYVKRVKQRLNENKRRERMSYRNKEYNELKTTLEKIGWLCVKNKNVGSEEYYSQGVLYANFTNKNKAIHIEYGDEDCVFGEIETEIAARKN